MFKRNLSARKVTGDTCHCFFWISCISVSVSDRQSFQVEEENGCLSCSTDHLREPTLLADFVLQTPVGGQNKKTAKGCDPAIYDTFKNLWHHLFLIMYKFSYLPVCF